MVIVSPINSETENNAYLVFIGTFFWSLITMQLVCLPSFEYM